MKKPTELEWKYMCYAVELYRLKHGFYGRNIWHFILRFHLSMSLRKRLNRLKDDFKDSKITTDEYNNWSEILKSAL